MHVVLWVMLVGFVWALLLYGLRRRSLRSKPERRLGERGNR